MKKLGTAFRLITLVTLVFGALAAGAPQPAQAQMSCKQYCREVCIANGETCCYITSNTCGCC
jgi:hypothetical protein